MTVGTSRKSLTFRQPFSLSGIDEVEPAGTDAVERDEELLPGLSFPGHRIATTLRSWDGGAIADEMANIDPLRLQGARERYAGLRTLADYHSDCLDHNEGLMS
jgi:hypothetical protein